MSDTDNSESQQTIDLAVAALEKRTGLKLAGLSQPEITQQGQTMAEGRPRGTE